MRVTFEKSFANGNVDVCPSKSYSHRMLLCAALSNGCTVKNVNLCDDIYATLSCLESLGANVYIKGNAVFCGGLDIFCVKDDTTLFCNCSATTLRLLIPLCLLCGKKVKFTGDKSLFSRPLFVYEKLCLDYGFLFIKDDNSLTVKGNLCSGNYAVDGSVSSQFVSGMLVALSLLGNSTLEVKPPFESRNYAMITKETLNSFGADIFYNDFRFEIGKKCSFKKSETKVEGDCSNAAALYAYNLLGGNVTVNGVPKNTMQGDAVFYDMFLGLKNGEQKFDLSDCIDLAPVMFALSAFNEKTVFSGVARLEIKESNRIEAMKEELAKFGVEMSFENGTVTVFGGRIEKPDTYVNSHNDHRIAMALSLLLSVTGGVMENAQAVSKSYPEFFEVLRKIGIKVI